MEPLFVQIEHLDLETQRIFQIDLADVTEVDFECEGRNRMLPAVGLGQADPVEQHVQRLVESQEVVSDVQMAVIVDPFGQDRGPVHDQQLVPANIETLARRGLARTLRW